jgi:MoxR-like ATPase
MALPILRHRLLLAPEAQVEGVTPDQVLMEVLDRVEVPR